MGASPEASRVCEVSDPDPLFAECRHDVGRWRSILQLKTHQAAGWWHRQQRCDSLHCIQALPEHLAVLKDLFEPLFGGPLLVHELE